MKIDLAHFKDKIKHAAFYIPFTGYFFVFAVAAVFAYKLQGQKEINNSSAYSDISAVLLKLTFTFTVAIISISFLTVLISYAFYLVKKRKEGILFKISTVTNETELNQKQPIKLFISPILKPLFGFIKLRLLYDDQHFSHKFLLSEKSNKKFFNTTIEGTYNWALPAIKEYQVERAVLYFEDIFQFFSIAVDLPAKNNFFTQPASKSIRSVNILPRKTEETSTRIEQIRKVEGEYLNYKNFENNDDVRRIVWKIYAKNKELVVRIPEIMDTYASHVYLYTSFHTAFSITGQKTIEVPFLNYFKVITWSIYKNLIEQGLEVRYIPDQELPKSHYPDEQQNVKYSISTSRWHQEKDLKSYINPSDAAMVLVSSLSNVEDVKELMDSYSKDITFIFIKLTDALKNQDLIDWVKWIFVKDQQDDIEIYKKNWMLSPMRNRVKENERKLEEILEKFVTV